MKILWLDDDTRPGLTRRIGDFEIRCVQTCAEAATALKASRPDVVIVDLVVPQGGWGKGLLNTPGLDFMSFVAASKERPKIVAYAYGLQKATRDAAKRSGADAAFDKMRTSFSDVLQTLAAVPEGRGQ